MTSLRELRTMSPLSQGGSEMGAADMEESTSINAKIVNTSTDGAFTGVVQAAGARQITPEDFAESKPKRNLRDWIIICLRAYGAALVAGLPTFTIIASTRTLASCLS